jgi:hypothetical protein
LQRFGHSAKSDLLGFPVHFSSCCLIEGAWLYRAPNRVKIKCDVFHFKNLSSASATNF